jgi:DNA-directed RNA polymerase subunit RPC12/RpoP
MPEFIPRRLGLAPSAEPQCPKCGSRDLENRSEEDGFSLDWEWWRCNRCSTEFNEEVILPK